MPTYEYACRDCGQHLEVVQSFRDEALTTCGSCDGSLRKVFSAAGIIFKGSGYYVTDTRKQAEDAKSAKSDKAKDSKKTGDGAKTSSDGAKTSSDGSTSSSEGSKSSSEAKSSSDKSATGGKAESA